MLSDGQESRQKVENASAVHRMVKVIMMIATKDSEREMGAVHDREVSRRRIADEAC